MPKKLVKSTGPTESRLQIYSANKFKKKHPPEVVASSFGIYRETFSDEFDKESLNPIVLSALLHAAARGYKVANPRAKDEMHAFFDGHIRLYTKRYSALFNKMLALTLANSLWSLASMQLRWDRLEKDLQDACLSALICNAPRINPQDISNSLWALAKMGLSWDRLGRDIQYACLSALARNQPGLKPQDISISLWALATMGLRWDLLGEYYRYTYLSVLARNALDLGLNAQEISNSLWALATMGLSWDRLRGDIQYACLSSLIYNAPRMNPQDISNSLWALATMGLSWDRLREDIQYACLDALKSNVPKMRPQGISNSLWALATMGLRWDGLGRDLQDAYLGFLKDNASGLGSQVISNALWALAVMLAPTDCCEITEAVKTLLTQALGCEKLNIKTSGGLLISAHYFKPVLPTSLFVNIEKRCLIPVDTKESFVQNSIYKSLRSRFTRDGDVLSEKIIGGAPADIYMPSHKLVIEIDGPSHQRLKQSLTDQLLNFIRTRDGMTVIRIDITQPLYNPDSIELLDRCIHEDSYEDLKVAGYAKIFYPPGHPTMTSTLPKEIPTMAASYDARALAIGLFGVRPSTNIRRISMLNPEAKEYYPRSVGTVAISK